MVSPLTHWTTVLRTYRKRGHAGLAEVQDRLESEAHEQPNGKFSKKQALYLPFAPFPPTVWRTSCARCRFWEEGEPGEPGRCHVVGREDDRFGGEAIHYRGWCAFWMPPVGEPAFAWIGQRLAPDGKTSVRGEYDPELTEKERRRAVRERLLTEPDVRRAAIHGTDSGRAGEGHTTPHSDVDARSRSEEAAASATEEDATTSTGAGALPSEDATARDEDRQTNDGGTATGRREVDDGE